MKKLMLFLFPLLLPFLVSARTADFTADTQDAFFAAVREQMRSGNRYFSVLADYAMEDTLSPAAVLDAVYRFDDRDTGNDLDDLRETVALQSVIASGNRYGFFFYYLSTPEEIAYVDREVEYIVSSLSVPGQGEAEQAQAIVNWICDNVTYDGSSRTAYAALETGRTNCVGYSVLAFKLLRAAGMDAKIVNGLDCNMIQHAWNLVKIDDAWYNLDVTWGDSGMTDRWFFRGINGFSDHSRFAAYSSERFNTLYRMSAEDLNYTPLSYQD